MITHSQVGTVQKSNKKLNSQPSVVCITPLGLPISGQLRFLFPWGLPKGGTGCHRPLERGGLLRGGKDVHGSLGPVSSRAALAASDFSSRFPAVASSLGSPGARLTAPRPVAPQEGEGSGVVFCSRCPRDSGSTARAVSWLRSEFRV